MLVVLFVKNKISFVDGSLLKSVVGDSTHVMRISDNNVVISWLYNSISQYTITSMLLTNTTAKIWKDLKPNFLGKIALGFFRFAENLCLFNKIYT